MRGLAQMVDCWLSVGQDRAQSVVRVECRSMAGGLIVASAVGREIYHQKQYFTSSLL